MAEHNSFWVTSGPRLCISREVEQERGVEGEVREGGRGKEGGRKRRKIEQQGNKR